MIVYFSGTGNSAYCAQLLADRLGDKAVDAFSYIRNGIAADLLSGTPWVFVAPTYAWRMPRIFEQFLRSGSFQGNDEAYFILTCGSEMGNASHYNRNLCREIGLNYRGSMQVVMPENYIALFSAPGPEEARGIIAAARPVLDNAAVRVRERLPFLAPDIGLGDRLKSALVNPLFYPLVVKADKFTVKPELCVSCGHCASSCPMDNIRLDPENPVWGDCCTHCMACICECPTEAIEYGKASVGKPRYQCPPYVPRAHKDQK